MIEQDKKTGESSQSTPFSGSATEGATLRSADQQQEPKPPRERPILFSAEMVRAILDGRKTQTRRVVADYNSEGNYKASEMDLSGAWPDGGKLKSYLAREVALAQGFEPDEIIERLYPRYEMCDRLWVREAHALVPSTAYAQSDGVQQTMHYADPWLAAIYREGWERSHGGLRWRPSIHMPRWASRITLEVTDVRVEHMQAISEEDAIAEGYAAGMTIDGDLVAGTARQAFAHGHFVADWEANFWVWVIEFRRIDAAALELAVDQRSISEATSVALQ